MVVLLPAPLGPRNAATSPCLIENVTSRAAAKAAVELGEPLGLDHRHIAELQDFTHGDVLSMGFNSNFQGS